MRATYSTPHPSGETLRPGPGSELPHPNPFNPSTTIRYRLDRPGWTLLEVYSIDGRHVATLVDDRREAGEHAITWTGTDRIGRAVASGHYLYRLRAPGGDRRVGHMTLVK